MTDEPDGYEVLGERGRHVAPRTWYVRDSAILLTGILLALILGIGAASYLAWRIVTYVFWVLALV